VEVYVKLIFGRRERKPGVSGVAEVVPQAKKEHVIASDPFGERGDLIAFNRLAEMQ
jgi:hypothetical protein